MVVVNIVYTIHLNVCLTLQSEKTQSFITVNHYWKKNILYCIKRAKYCTKKQT